MRRRGERDYAPGSGVGSGAGPSVIGIRRCSQSRIIIEQETRLDMAAFVAYEHHIMLNGGGYPTLRYPRDCHYASKVVHVCDVYDALCTDRPYRPAWTSERALGYLAERSVTEFDPELVDAFTRMIRDWDQRRMPMTDGPAPEPTPEPGA